jgi:hypothetical protein
MRRSLIPFAVVAAVVLTPVPVGPADSSGPALETAASPRLGDQAYRVAADLHIADPGWVPYSRSNPEPLTDPGITDAAGVRMTRLPGRPGLWEYPVGQAWSAIVSSASYQLTGNPAYLRRAELNAERLVQRRVTYRGGWFFPYSYDFAVEGDDALLLRAPWYSAMAQGRALSAFVRLYQVTGQSRWRAAADATMRSFEVPPSGGRPFVSWVDGEAHLWLDEYPRARTDTSERVFNGHVYAAFGIYDYWRLTRDPTARAMLLGALTTVRDTASTQFRRPGGPSVYSLEHRSPNVGYHQVDVGQLLLLYRLTGDRAFALDAWQFRADLPARFISGVLHLVAGTHQQLDVDRATRTHGQARSVSFSRPVDLPAVMRLRLSDGSTAVEVADGRWFPEIRGVSWVLGATDVHLYVPQLEVSVPAGRYADMLGSRVVRVGHATTARADRSALVGARTCFHFSSGPLAGLWVAGTLAGSLAPME